MKIQHNRYFYVALLVPLTFLPGCGVSDWVKNKLGGSKQADQSVDFANPLCNISSDDASEVLVTIKGQPAITINSFEQEFDSLLEDNPQLKSMLPFMPDARKNLLTGLTQQEVVDCYIYEQGINKQEDYQRDLARFERSMKRALNTKYFAAKHPVTIEEADVRTYYDANKDKMQELVVSKGGVPACGVRFEKEADAKAFLAKAQGKSVMEIAKAEKMSDKAKDFEIVHKHSTGMDTMLRFKILALEKTPTTEVIKVSDKEFWVVQAGAKEGPKYRAFEEVKEPLRQLVEREKTNEVLQKALEDLKQSMQVVINYDYFKQQDVSEESQLPVMANQQETCSASQHAQQEPTAPVPSRVA